MANCIRMEIYIKLSLDLATRDLTCAHTYACLNAPKVAKEAYLYRV